MRVPLEWLREYCDPPLGVEEIEERLTMTGTKVEAVHRHGVAGVEGFVVGRVLDVRAHPQADRLRVCEVDLGGAREGPATIVCGAPNVAAGQRVAVALPGARMPDGSALRAATLRGVASEGMILAEDELQIGPGHEGILVLDGLDGGAPEPGTPLAQLLPLATAVLELEVTPNRPDCLGVYGVARELHAATGAPLAPEPWREDPGSFGPLAGVQVNVECPELNPRFTARLFEGVEIGPSPPWLKARLSAAGQRPINNVVDITNYVMWLTSQPLHAFDFDRVAGGRLTVRRAHEGERVVTLDGEQRALDEEMVVIEDGEGPTSIAGVMGGERSEVQASTRRVLMEVANWNGPNIHRTSWALGLRSEASSRFEKGLAPEQCTEAQAMAAQLMVALCGARTVPGTIDVGGPGPAPAVIRLRERRVREVLGVPVARARQREILQALGFATADADDGLDVSVPPLRRHDVTREADLIEEVARIDGLERLPATLPRRRGAYGRLTAAQRLRRRALDVLAGRGLYEVVGWTFTSPALADRLRLAPDDERRVRAVPLRNPLSTEHSLLRTTLLGSLLDVAALNVARGVEELQLFEVGTIFASDGAGGQGGAERETGVHEHRSLAVLVRGAVRPASWGEPRPPQADFFAMKALLEALAGALGVEVSCAREPAPAPFLHPGRSARVVAGEELAGEEAAGGEVLGWLGELHPLIARAWELDSAAAAAPGGEGRAPVAMEIDLDRLIALAQHERGYRDLISFPALRQDLAVVLALDVPAAQALAAVRAAGGELLDDAHVFDVYSGPQIGEGRRSLALALSFRSAERTLSDAQVAPLRARIVEALERLGGELRG